MDSLRGKFGFSDGADDDASWDDAGDEGELGIDDAPPAPIGQDERRMQVRAYNYWASLLGERTYPSVEDIEPDSLPDFSENSVLLDFTGGIENPAIVFLGDKLAGECGHEGPIETLDDVPPRSLLSRITDHYMQILANQAPVGFEAEFINQRDITILYRGILLPFSTDDDTIDFIYGVINWKEVADQLTTDELLLEIDQALQSEQDREEDAPVEIARRAVVAPRIIRWADGPGSEIDEPEHSERPGEPDDSLPCPSFARLDTHLGGTKTSGRALLGESPANDYAYDDGACDSDDDDSEGTVSFDPLAAMRPVAPSGNLEQCLAVAREAAATAQQAEVRSRVALYHAVSNAYDVSLAAANEPEAFTRLLEDHDITAVPRAPMTPVVKLVFGAGYDKSRLAEYAAVLDFAHREDVAHGGLADLLETTEGGLKAIVARERAFRRGGDKPATAKPALERTLRKLGKVEAQPIHAIPADGAEYALCVIRRDSDGEIAFIGEVTGDDRLLARAARNILG